MTKAHVSVGAGFENDRRDLGSAAAKALAQLDGPKFLIFECLAERTLAKQVQTNDLHAQIEHAWSFVEPCLDQCRASDIKIISNFGGIDPLGVAKGLRAKIGSDVPIAAVTGDNLPLTDEDGANALARHVYTGASGIAQALAKGAQIVVAGRVSDPSLVVGPVVHSLRLDWTDWTALAHATMAGHLIECGAQITGGYFWDVGHPPLPATTLAPPVATISKDGVVLSKPLGDGRLDRATVTEQLLYEIGDPAAYKTPDVILDLTKVEILETDSGVELTKAIGHPAPDTLKSLLSQHTGWSGEAEISYFGTTAAARAQWARDMMAARLGPQDMRLEVFDGTVDGTPTARLRLSIRTKIKQDATHALNEMEALYLNGPSAGGGVRKTLTPQVETTASLISKAKLPPQTVDMIP